jgi:hypothetical protein
VPCYIFLAVQQFLPNNQILTILRPPYSSGFTPYSFWLYLRPKNWLKFCCFHMQKHSTECTAGSTAMGKEYFQMCLQKWQGWSKLCVCARAYKCQKIRALHFSLRDGW